MALYKSVKQEDGVVTNYHRILYITITTNRQNSIAVGSYVDADSREYEKTGEFAQPYRQGVTYEVAYDPSMTIEKAYDYLKTLPLFEGATNV
jgi:predicted small secreted protein